MLFYYAYYFKYICIGALLVSLLVSVFTMYAYSINSQRTAEDPEKKKLSSHCTCDRFFYLADSTAGVTLSILAPGVILWHLRYHLYHNSASCSSGKV